MFKRFNIFPALFCLLILNSCNYFFEIPKIDRVENVSFNEYFSEIKSLHNDRFFKDLRYYGPNKRLGDSVRFIEFIDSTEIALFPSGKFKKYEVYNLGNLFKNKTEALKKSIDIYVTCEKLGLGYDNTEHYGTINFHFDTRLLLKESIPPYVKPDLIPNVKESFQSSFIFANEKNENLQKWFNHLNPLTIDTNWYYYSK